MQKLVEVKRRMEVVRGIQTITRTMATVASAKLSRTRERAAGMRQYSEGLREVIHRQQLYAAQRDVPFESLSPFLAERPAPRTALLIHLAADRGMCGAYNLAINHEAVRLASELRERGLEVSAHAKGARGGRYLRRRTDIPVLECEFWLREGVTPAEVDSLHERASEAFLGGQADEVWCTYTRFFSPLRREPRAVRLLPLAPWTGAPVRAAAVPELWFYEPESEPILMELLSAFLRLQIEDVLLESYASEQGARMITMEEATERAARTLQDLTVRHNRLRREVITTDLLGVLFASRLGANHRG